MDKRLNKVLSVFALFGLPLVGACAGGPPPVDQMAQAERTLSEAREVTASMNAPLELKVAEERLNAARGAMGHCNYDSARLLIEKAQADADVAIAKARSARAQEVAKAMRDSVDALRNEIDREKTWEVLR